MFSKTEAIKIMNEWGSEKKPFLFIIDFEMKMIRLFRLDLPLPGSLIYNFRGIGNEMDQKPPAEGLSFQKFPVSFHDYQQAYSLVMEEIKAGNTFLINLTLPTPIQTNLSLRQLFEVSRAPYKLLLDGEFVCFSPEPFIRIQNGTITAYPMKGTINASVHDAVQVILSDKKETAEHNTIVDLLRNDLSRIAFPVSVKRFRYIDRITTHAGDILQVSSEITGKLRPAFAGSLGDMLFNLLPAGSVTGAPKPKTTAIIRQVEKIERGYYTGICGVFDGENVDSAVMIRFIEVRNGTMIFRSGGGITFLSDARKEYEELIDKVYVPVA
ncbi:MAG TPA: aminodeoxychorismate synthase component I [Bacteroidales bacterium]|nr:aminodeoxychorismate synthase component I [Bacteroidales bacterium]